MDMNRAKRLNERINFPHFFENELECETFVDEKRPGSFHFSTEIHDQDPVTFFGLIDENQSPQKLLAMKYSCKEKNILTGFIDAYIDLITDKDEMKIQAINFREVESFLRDQNHIPILGEKSSLAIAFFETTKKKITQIFSGGPEPRPTGVRSSPTIRNDYTPQNPTLLSKYDGRLYIDLNSQEKQQFIVKIMQDFITPKLMRDGGGAAVIFADDAMVVIDYLGACVSCSFSLSSTLSFIQQVFRYETQNPNLLLMTDS